MATVRPRSRIFGVILAASVTLQSSLFAYAAPGAESTEKQNSQTIAFATAPDTSRFSALEEAVGLNVRENSPELQSETPMFAPRESNSEFSETASNSGSGHFINLSELAEGSSKSSSPLLDRMDLIASAAPMASSSTPVLSVTITNDPVVARSRVDDLTRQILLKIVELERFNLHYKQEVAFQGRWKGWRYGTLQEVNGGLNLAGGIVGVAERGSHLRKQGKHVAGAIHTSVQQNANILGLIGSSVGALAALNEFGVNEYHDVKARQHGYGPGAARAKVEGLRNDINRLLTERTANAAVERTSNALQGHAAVDDCEGKVLVDLRDQGIMEFQRFHVAARKLFAFQQSQYMFDFAKYTTNAIGFEFAFLALHKHDRKWNVKAGILFEVSGALTMFGPIISRYIGKAVAEAHKSYIHGTIQEAEAAKVEDLVNDKAKLDELCKATMSQEDAASAITRANIYGDQSKTFQDELQSGSKARAKANLSATQNIGSGLFVGSCKVASGVLFNVVGGNKHYNNSSARAGRVTNANLFTGSVISLPATTYSMLDTLRINVRGEIDRHKLMAAGLHPTQLVTARLSQLDDIERRLGGAHVAK